MTYDWTGIKICRTAAVCCKRQGCSSGFPAAPGTCKRAGATGVVSQDVWMGGWYSGCSCGRGNIHLLTAFGVFLAGLGGLIAVNRIVPLFLPGSLEARPGPV